MPYSQSLMGLQSGSPLAWPISTRGTTPSISPTLLMDEGVGGFPPHIYEGGAKGNRPSQLCRPSYSRCYSTRGTVHAVNSDRPSTLPFSCRAPWCWHTDARRSDLRTCGYLGGATSGALGRTASCRTRRAFATARHCHIDALSYIDTVPLHLRV